MVDNGRVLRNRSTLRRSSSMAPVISSQRDTRALRVLITFRKCALEFQVNGFQQAATRLIDLQNWCRDCTTPSCIEAYEKLRTRCVALQCASVFQPEYDSTKSLRVGTFTQLSGISAWRELIGSPNISTPSLSSASSVEVIVRLDETRSMAFLNHHEQMNDAQPNKIFHLIASVMLSFCLSIFSDSDCHPLTSHLDRHGQRDVICVDNLTDLFSNSR